MLGTCRCIPTLALQHNCYNCHTIEVQKLRKLHSPLLCLDRWCLVLRRHGHVCHWIKIMSLRNLHRLWPVCMFGIGVATQLSHLPLGRGDLPLHYQWSIHESVNEKHYGFDRSLHLRIIGICRCVIPDQDTGSAVPPTVFCLVWIVGPWCLSRSRH